MKKVIISAVVLVVVIVGAMMLTRGEKASESSSPSPTLSLEVTATPSTSATATPDASQTSRPTNTATPTASTTPASAKKTFTMAQVSMHADATSCWSAIAGKVYDLTSWIAQHPGGEEGILKICGKDGTALFTGQHADNPKQLNILATFYIGDLAK